MQLSSTAKTTHSTNILETFYAIDEKNPQKVPNSGSLCSCHTMFFIIPGCSLTRTIIMFNTNFRRTQSAADVRTMYY